MVQYVYQNEVPDFISLFLEIKTSTVVCFKNDLFIKNVYFVSKEPIISRLMLVFVNLKNALFGI